MKAARMTTSDVELQSVIGPELTVLVPLHWLKMKI